MNGMLFLFLMQIHFRQLSPHAVVRTLQISQEKKNIFLKKSHIMQFPALAAPRSGAAAPGPVSASPWPGCATSTRTVTTHPTSKSAVSIYIFQVISKKSFFLIS